MKFKGLFKISHYGKDGELKAKYRVPNGIVNDGKIKILDVMFNADAQIDPWYFGLIDGAATPILAAIDVMLLHSGWTENQNYSEGVRQTWVEAAAALDGSDVKMKTTTEATFTINSNGQKIAGLFITSDSAHSPGNTGILWSTALFDSVKNLDNGDTLKVEYEITVG